MIDAMNRLSDADIVEAQRQLRSELIHILGATPKGLSDQDILKAFKQACNEWDIKLPI